MRVICVTIKQSYNRPRKGSTGSDSDSESLQAVCLRTRTRRLTRPMARSCYILADSDYDCGQRLSLERREPCANADSGSALVREASGVTTTLPRQGLRIKRLPHTGSIQHFSVLKSVPGTGSEAGRNRT